MENIGGNILEVAADDESTVERCVINGFTAGKIIGCFETKREGTPTEVETGLQCWKVDDNLEKYVGGRSLGLGYKNKPTEYFITDYPTFRNRRDETFYRYLIGHQYFQKNTEKHRPDFVCSKDVMKEMFIVPVNNGSLADFHFFARRFQGIIFIQPPESKDRKIKDERTHEGIVYAMRVTGQKVVGYFDEHVERHLIREVEFRPYLQDDTSFRLLLTHDAYVNQKGEGVEIRAINSWNWNPDDSHIQGEREELLRQKYLRFYRNMAVIGAKELILGHRNGKGVLETNERLNIEQVWQRTNVPVRGREKCHEFLGRLLLWLKHQFEGDEDETKIVRFWCEEGEDETDPRRVFKSKDVTGDEDIPTLTSLLGKLLRKL